MPEQRLIVGLIFFILISSLSLNYFSENLEKEGKDNLDKLSFSTTQIWDPDIYAILNTEPLLSPQVRSSIKLPPPPINSSKEVEEELKNLHQLANSRTQAHLSAIEAELDMSTLYMGKHTITDLVNNPHYASTSALLKRTFNAFTGEVIRQKEYFDRVRPSVLDPSLTTAIPVPGHPAYPSGHASQSMFLALLLAELDSSNKVEYITKAESIAYNREIAGVHYRSDSTVGQDLARQYFSLLMQDTWFLESLAAAKTEWAEVLQDE